MLTPLLILAKHCISSSNAVLQIVVYPELERIATRAPGVTSVGQQKASLARSNRLGIRFRAVRPSEQPFDFQDPDVPTDDHRWMCLCNSEFPIC